MTVERVAFAIQEAVQRAVRHGWQICGCRYMAVTLSHAKSRWQIRVGMNWIGRAVVNRIDERGVP